MKPQLSFLNALLLLFTLACVGQPKQNKRPNVLLVISDDQSYEHTSFNGCKYVNTPAFDKVASEGIYFANCYAGSPGCAPSRSALVTGRHHWQNEQSGQHASSWLKKYVPFVDELEANGYAVGRTGKGVGPFKYANNEDDLSRRKEDAAGPSFGHVSYIGSEDEQLTKGMSNTNYAENFKYFMEQEKGDKPFFFWYGAHEPHRGYEKGSWRKAGKKLADVDVPKFLPDNDEIRGDLLDYSVEIEWFDSHLQKILNYLEEIGELDNTVVIVTADNGMPFPRAKANCYDYGVHVPLAIRYPKQINAGRTTNTPVGFVDIAPTLFDALKITPIKMLPITGKSIWPLITNTENDDERVAFSGRERHSSSRYMNWGYPQRSVRKGDYLLIWNLKPERWPAGAPQRFDAKDPTSLNPMYGLDEQGNYTFSGAFADIDDSPSKAYLIEHNDDEQTSDFFHLAIDKRPEYELFNLESDQYCLTNLSGSIDSKDTENNLKSLLLNELKRTKDPRIVGPVFDVFDTYKRYSKMRKFPKPESMHVQ